MFWFPQPRPLKLRLKDMLEDKVDEKYYLNEVHTKTLLANSKISKQIEGRITARLNKHNKDIGGARATF